MPSGSFFTHLRSPSLEEQQGSRNPSRKESPEPRGAAGAAKSGGLGVPSTPPAVRRDPDSDGARRSRNFPPQAQLGAGKDAQAPRRAGVLPPPPPENRCDGGAFR